MISTGQVMVGSYNPGLVVLSVCIAMVASYAALDLAGRVTYASGKTRLLWLTGGATAMGIGIWSMHYIGMLAFRLPVPVKYDWPTVLLSMLAAIMASAVALFVVSRKTLGIFRAAVGGIFMGGGIAAMHYIGMAAMRVPATCSYSPALVLISVALAVGISFVAIWLTFHLRNETSEWGWRKTISALVMGAAIPVMHYTGMAAAQFTPSTVVQNMSHAVSISSIGVAGIVIVTFMVLGIVLLTSTADRRFSLQAAELASSDERYRRILNTAFDAFVGVNESGLITDWNEQAEIAFGWSRSEALGQNLSKMIISDHDLKTGVQGLQNLMTTREGASLKKRIEITAMHKDGHEFPVELAISGISWKKTRLLALFVHDVTARNRADAALRQAEEKYRGIFEQSIVGIFQTSPDGRVLSANPALARMHGYDSPEEMMAAPGDLATWSYIERGSREMFKRLIEEKGTVEDFEYQVHRKDGVAVWLSENARAVRDSDGNVSYYVGTVEDITERKRSQEKLELEIVERKRAEAAAEEASRVKSEFLANMSHEIRTPLNGIMGMTDLALESDLAPETREYLDTVKISADSLLVVINDILDYSKMEARSMVLDAADFNLRDRLEATLKTLAVPAHEKDLELLCEIAPDIPEFVRGDANRLRQIIVNLVGNAIKFTEAGEVGLNVQLLPANGTRHVLHFTVTDTGIGIPLDKQELIFHPFIQADASTTRKYGGTGLGLAISNRLVEMMRGKMWVESEISRGTKFHFTVELEMAHAQALGFAAISPPEVLRGVKVLVVDDDHTNRRILEGMLIRWEMKPVSVEGAEEALAELSAAFVAGKPYQLILTDMHMPDVDGFSLIERIRSSPHPETAAIMMLTSAGHRGDAERCRDLAVAAYLLKPVRQSELREAITRVLRPSRGDSPPALITRYSLHGAREGPAMSLRILVAEDNIVNQHLATRILEKRGHHVSVAANGREVLAALDKETYDLILMDLQMPEIDGLQATIAIRNREKRLGKHVPIIAVTAHAMVSDRERCFAAGMDGYVTKPLQIAELFAAIEVFFPLAAASSSLAKSAVSR